MEQKQKVKKVKNEDIQRLQNEIEKVNNEIRRIEEDLDSHKDNKAFIMKLANLKECKRVIKARRLNIKKPNKNQFFMTEENKDDFEDETIEDEGIPFDKATIGELLEDLEEQNLFLINHIQDLED